MARTKAATPPPNDHVEDSITVSSGQGSSSSEKKARPHRSSSPAPLQPSSGSKRPSRAARKSKNPDEAKNKVVKVSLKITKKPSAATLKRQEKTWQVPFVTKNDKSPLVTNPAIDIRVLIPAANKQAILANPRAWDCLPPEDRKEILSFFPEGTFVLGAGTEDARPDVEAMLNSNDFRNDCSRYLDNIREGRHDPEYIRQAWEAHWLRFNGFFKEYQAAKFKMNWDMNPPAPLAQSGAKEDTRQDGQQEQVKSDGEQQKKPQDTKHDGEVHAQQVQPEDQPQQDHPEKKQHSASHLGQNGVDKASSAEAQPKPEAAAGAQEGTSDQGVQDQSSSATPSNSRSSKSTKSAVSPDPATATSNRRRKS